MFQRIAKMTNPLQLAVILAGLVCQLNVKRKYTAILHTCHCKHGFPPQAFLPADFVLVKTPYKFPGSCERAEWSKSLPKKATIASYQNQIWRIEAGFREEFTWKENHLLLNSAKFTDQGHYEVVCNGVKNSFKLVVLYAIDVHVEEMDNTTLDCYADSANDVTWLHNNETILHYKKDGFIKCDKSYEGRVSVEKDCFKTGDISLTITGVRKTDAGVYRCFVDDETNQGYPHTYVLSHVNGNRSSSGDPTDSNCNEAHSLIIYKSLTIVFGIISFILLLIIVIPVLYRQSTSATATALVPNSDENDRMIMEDTASPNNDNQSMVRHSVEESEPTENKPSNTKPF